MTLLDLDVRTHLHFPPLFSSFFPRSAGLWSSSLHWRLSFVSREIRWEETEVNLWCGRGNCGTPRGRRDTSGDCFKFLFRPVCLRRVSSSHLPRDPEGHLIFIFFVYGFVPTFSIVRNVYKCTLFNCEHRDVFMLLMYTRSGFSNCPK